jgi:CheY-like chemotaxis protein
MTLRILAVDDDPLNRTLIRASIARAPDPALSGASLREAASIGEARARLAEEPADVLLLDVHLPDGLGFELAAELREGPAPPSILVLTASVLPAEQRAAMEAGCDAFLAKPYLPAALLEAISSLVERRERRPS